MVATLPPTNTTALAHRVLDNITLTLKQPTLRANEAVYNDLVYVQVSADKFLKRLEQASAQREPFTEQLIHELRGPLSVMVGYLELVQETITEDEVPDDPRTKTMIEELHRDSMALCTALEQHYNH